MTKSIGLGDGAQGARHWESEFLSTLIGEGVDPSEERFGRHQGAMRVQAPTEGTHGGGGPAYWTGLMREVISMQSEGQIRDVLSGGACNQAHRLEIERAPKEIERRIDPRLPIGNHHLDLLDVGRRRGASSDTAPTDEHGTEGFVPQAAIRRARIKRERRVRR